MKKNSIFLLFFISLFFFNCKTTSESKILNDQLKLDYLDSNKVKIFFPQFYDSEGRYYNGDGVVICLPDNKTIVIDGFVLSASNSYINFLKSLGISKIDYLIASHFHSDHIGSFPELIKNFEIGSFYSNGAPINRPQSLKLMELIQNKNIPHIILTKGDKVQFNQDCYIDVFWPSLSENDIDNIKNNPGRTEKLINLSSLVFKLHYRTFSTLFTGDIYKAGDKELTKEYGSKLKSTIIKVPHHGEFYTANSPSFVKTVNADYGVIQDNRYITSIIKQRYKKAGTKLLYRLSPGYILIESDGNNYVISENDYLK